MAKKMTVDAYEGLRDKAKKPLEDYTLYRNASPDLKAVLEVIWLGGFVAGKREFIDEIKNTLKD